MVSKILEKAFDEASQLPEEEQRQLAGWILEELESERGWARVLSDSADELGDLADEALREHAEGETKELDPKKL